MTLCFTVTQCELEPCKTLDAGAQCALTDTGRFYDCSCSDMYAGDNCQLCNAAAGYTAADGQTGCVCDAGRGYTQQDGVCSEYFQYLSSPVFRPLPEGIYSPQ